MKILKLVPLFLISLSLFTGCSKQTFTGLWKIDLKLQRNSLPFIIELKQDKDEISGVLYNSDEKLTLNGKIVEELNENLAIIEIGPHYSELRIKLDGDTLDGEWVRTNKEDYRVALKGERINSPDWLVKYQNEKPDYQLGGNWKVKWDTDKEGLGVFTQNGNRLKGSILTNTGDYRFLEGYIEKDLVRLYGFDGVFSFIFELKLQSSKFFSGNMLSGKSYQTSIQGVKDPHYALSDPLNMTNKTNDKPIGKLGTSISGESIDLSEKKYNDSIKIIQLFGSWCPNCVDETKFFNRWRKENSELAKNIQFVALAFENFKDEKQAIRALKKSKAKLEMDYPLILVDYDKTIKPQDVLPIDKARAFPTTLFLNKKNEVVKIHTGFSGQATGAFFENFEKLFTQTVTDLLNK